VGARAAGLDEACRRDSILFGQAVEDLLGPQTQGGQTLIGKLDEDALCLLAKDIDLLHPGQT
jgi:hypothetical protein